jgi:hypothetical protein
MKAAGTAFFLTTMVIVMSPGPLLAQWPSIRTPGVPRKPDGSPNLSAPAPRTADGKPDLSGIWHPENNKPCPKDGCNDMEIMQEFTDIGWSVKGGLPLQPWAADLVNARLKGNGNDDPGSRCLPTGIVKFQTSPFFRRIVQLPDSVLMLSEREVTFRQIFLDGRPLPVDPTPTPNGYSSGKWMGDTLVVQTSGIPDGQWLDRNGNPLTGAAKITERYKRVNFGRLEIEITIDDPKAYTKPWSVKINHDIAVDTPMIDYFCNENEKDVPHLTGK